MDVEQSLPPRSVMFPGTIILVPSNRLVNQLVPLGTVMYHPVYRPPVGESSDVTVVDKEVNLQFAAEVVVVGERLFRIVAVDGIELYAAFTAPFHSLVEQFPLSYTPQDDLVTLCNEHSQGLHSKGFLLSDLRIAVLDNRPVEINCN